MGAAEPLRRKRDGWSLGIESRESLPRHELPAEHLHSVEIQADPLGPAWDEAGYIDPDFHHANLPDGTRYWQGYARSTRARNRGEERPLSPEFVTRVTRRYYPDHAPLTTEEEMAPSWKRRTRTKERNLLSLFHWSIWHG